MANMTIESYTAALTIDPVNDLLLLYQNSSGTYKSISRNTYLALASAPLGLTDSQSPTNKTFNNTNSFTIKDGSLTLQNSASVTKQAVFSLASITAGQTRTITVPDASGTLGLLGSSQTWSGTNAFSGSSWSGGTISNTAISADTITGFTTSNSGNIYGIGVVAGVITGAGTVGSTALITNAVQASQIANNAITLASVNSSTSQTGISSTTVILTGLTTTVTIPAGGRKIRIEAYVPSISSTAISTISLYIFNSATVTGSAVQASKNLFAVASATGMSVYTFYEYTPAAGTQSYCAAVAIDTGTGATSLTTAQLAYLTVKAI